MKIDNTDPSALRIQLEVLKEKLRTAEKKCLKLERENSDYLLELGSKNNDIQKLMNDVADLKINLEVEKQRNRHLTEINSQSRRKSDRKEKNAKIQAFLASVLFLVVSVLSGFGINKITAVPPDLSGWLFVIMSIITYIVAALLTTLLASEGSN